ncbi:unnamed protein product [Caenorhabditis brenneri]
MSIELSKFDVILVIDGMRIHYVKQWLAKHSTYFQSMFFSNFVEKKNKKEIEIKGIVLEDFHVFLGAISGINRVTDENVENALAMSTFLGSSELEKMCMTHLAQGSKIPLKEQFHLAEKHCSENLMIQVCSSIKDAYELDEVVPKDLDSFCNKTKNIVLRRSFELLGIRKPPLPPQSEQPAKVFEDMMNEFLDQADIQNRHGTILADQAVLLKKHIIYEEYLDRIIPEAKPLIQQDPRINELMEELRNTHSPAERNAVLAQILVVKTKNMYTRKCEKGESQDPTASLEKLYRIIHRNKRDHSTPQPSVRGELLIDHMYRRTIETVKEKLAAEVALQNDGVEPIWATKICEEYAELLPWREEVTQNTSDHISETFRGVSEEAQFHGLTRFVQIARESFYMGWMRREEDNWNQNQAEQEVQE